MSDGMLIQQGSIVWAKVADRHGISKPTPRPLVVITSSDEILIDQPIVALAITTSFPDPPRENQVEVPWSRTGLVPTGLRRRSAVVCDWAVTLRPSDVVEVGGILPARYLLLVLERVARIRTDQ